MWIGLTWLWIGAADTVIKLHGQSDDNIASILILSYTLKMKVVRTSDALLTTYRSTLLRRQQDISPHMVKFQENVTLFFHYHVTTR